MPLKKGKCKKAKGKKRVVNKVSLIVSILAIFGMALSFVAFRYSVKKVELAHLQESIKTSAKHKLADMNDIINKMVSDLEETAKAINEYEDLHHPDVKKILEVSNDINWFEYTAIADSDGIGYDNAGNTFNNADREYFKTAMQGQVAFSEVMDSKVFEGDEVQIIAHPIRAEDGHVRGVVFGIMSIDTFEKIVLQKEVQSENNVYIIDSCGKYIGKFREDSKISSNRNFWAHLENIGLDNQTISKIKSDFEERKEGEYSYTYEGKMYYAAHAPIGPNKWQLVYSVSDSSTKQIIRSLYILDAKSAIFGSVCYLVLMLCIMWNFKNSNDNIRKAHQEAKRNMEYMHIAMSHSNHTMFEYDQKSGVVRLNSEVQNPLLHGSVMKDVPESFISMDLIAPSSISSFKRLFERIKTEHSCEEDIQSSRNEKIWYRISMHNIYDEQNKIIGTVGVVEDISDQKQTEAEMKKKLQIQDALIANALFHAKVDLATGILSELNGQRVQIDFQEFLHRSIHKKVSKEYSAYVEQKLSLESLKCAYRQDKDADEIQFMIKRDEGDKWVSCVVYRIDRDGEDMALLIVTDIDDRKRREIALKEQAERDGLTGLYNATATCSKINEVLSSKNAANENNAFILFDLDNFKQINDTFGHSYGDQVLIDIAKILNTRFRSDDIIGRLGGDEFIILLRNIKSYDYAEYLLKELCDTINRTYREGNQEVSISASIGVVMAPSEGNTFEELYKKADAAQYQIKRHGKNGVKVYE